MQLHIDQRPYRVAQLLTFALAFLLARLQIASEARARQRGVYRPVQSPGAQQVGYCSLRSPSAGAGQQIGVGLNFVPVLSTTPTGLSFTAITLTPYGCEVTVSAAAAGPVLWTGKYTTVGA